MKIILWTLGGIWFSFALVFLLALASAAAKRVASREAEKGAEAIAPKRWRWKSRTRISTPCNAAMKLSS